MEPSLNSSIKPISLGQQKVLDDMHIKSLLLNPLGDRLRKCPGCGIYHFVKHRSTDYCSSECAVDHYNSKRKVDFHAVKAGVLKKVQYQIYSPSNLNIHIPSTAAIDVHAKQIQESKLQNERILKQLIGNTIEVSIRPDKLFSQGFDGDLFDFRVPYPGSTLNFCVYGDYTISWIQTNLLNINHLKDMLWAFT